MKDVKDIVKDNGTFVIFATQPLEPHEAMSFFVENQIFFKVLLGSYKNEREVSYCVKSEDFSRIVDAGMVEDQESVLVLGIMDDSVGLRKAEIVYLDEREPEPKGYFKHVKREEALSGAGWTFDPMAGSFHTLGELQAA